MAGVPELADEIYMSRSQKKTVAVANGTAASAAYWLAVSTSEMVVIPSGEVGSIGVFAAHEDVSKALESEGVKISLISAGKFKIDGNPYEPLTDSARADLQSKVDAFYGMFASSVARGRRALVSDVRGGFGQGRMVLAAQAVKEGMADRVATMDDTLARLGIGGNVGMAAAGAERRLVSGSRNIEQRRRELDQLCAGDNPSPLLDLERRRKELDLL